MTTNFRFMQCFDLNTMILSNVSILCHFKTISTDNGRILRDLNFAGK